jgi:hypothetical protein
MGWLESLLSVSANDIEILFHGRLRNPIVHTMGAQAAI